MVPVLVGAALALSHEGAVSWILFPLVIVCSLLFHAATNVLSDYFDFKKGVDQDYTYGSSRVLVDGLMRPKEVLLFGWLLFGVGCGLGLVLAVVRGVPMLALGVVGLLGGYFYAGSPFGYKYIALGDVAVFILMGPLMVIGSYLALTGGYAPAVLYASLPIGCLVAAILHANNLRDITHDAEAKVKTLANVLGHTAAKWEYLLLVGGAYVSVIVMVAARILTPWALIVFVSLPPPVRNIAAIWRSEPGGPEDLATIDVQTAQHHLLFGALFAGAIAAGALI